MVIVVIVMMTKIMNTITMIVLYCIVLIRFYSASLSMNLSEAPQTAALILCRS